MEKLEEPLVEVRLGDHRITLLGTAHVSRSSVRKVEELLAENTFDAVAVELCPSRYQAITDPNALTTMDMFQVLREGKTPMVIANLALSTFQQKIAEDLGIEPGAEMRAALKGAQRRMLPFLLVDREIGTTLKRCYGNIPLWQRLYLFAGLISSVFSSEKISDHDIEKLKQGDLMEAALAHFADTHRSLFIPLIEERDRYMATRMREEISKHDYRNLLAVVGAGHLKGIESYLNDSYRYSEHDLKKILSELDEIPPGSRWLNVVPWLIVGLIVAGFSIGFKRSTDLGWQMVADWILINGGLSALGALLAAAHPLTVVTAFLAAPLTSLNPMIGAGMVTAAAELFLHKPSVGDFSQLRHDATTVRGWWKNRVARTLLVFLFSTIGSAVGTYVAGFRIFERLT